MSLGSMVSGDYGQVIKLTFMDVDTSAAADISSYSTSQKMIFTSPAGVVTEKTASFDTTGADGIIKYTVEASFLTAGNWKVRGRVTKAAATLTTEEETFLVLS